MLAFLFVPVFSLCLGHQSLHLCQWLLGLSLKQQPTHETMPQLFFIAFSATELSQHWPHLNCHSTKVQFPSMTLTIMQIWCHQNQCHFKIFTQFQVLFFEWEWPLYPMIHFKQWNNISDHVRGDTCDKWAVGNQFTRKQWTDAWVFNWQGPWGFISRMCLATFVAFTCVPLSIFSGSWHGGKGIGGFPTGFNAKWGSHGNMMFYLAFLGYGLL